MSNRSPASLYAPFVIQKFHSFHVTFFNVLTFLYLVLTFLYYFQIDCPYPASEPLVCFCQQSFHLCRFLPNPFFRFHITIGSVGFGCILPTAGRIDFHPLEYVPTRYTNGLRIHYQCILSLLLSYYQLFKHPIMAYNCRIHVSPSYLKTSPDNNFGYMVPSLNKHLWLWEMPSKWLSLPIG